MKPLDPEAHEHLAAWVRKGGVLLYSGRDNDPFQTVQEWWNTGDNHFAAASDHLFELMGIPAGAEEGEYKYGKGTVYIMRADPKEYVLSAGGDRKFLDTVCRLYSDRAKAGKVEFKNSFYLERGPYDIVAVMNESVSDAPYTVTGTMIDLFDPELPVLKSKEIAPGYCGYFLDIDRIRNKGAQVLAASNRIYDEQTGKNSYSYVAKSPIQTTGISRVLLPACPVSVLVDGKEVFDPAGWDNDSMTYLLTYENNPDGVSVKFVW